VDIRNGGGYIAPLRFGKTGLRAADRRRLVLRWQGSMQKNICHVPKDDVIAAVVTRASAGLPPDIHDDDHGVERAVVLAAFVPQVTANHLC
jgi:hypothetical protein